MGKSDALRPQRRRLSALHRAPCWGPGEAGGVHKGTESVTTSAQDVGGGVQSIVLSADGQPAETYSAPCNFTFAQPCPSSTGAQTLTLPTTELSDGTHTLTLVATDAAGNQSPVASEQITVKNHESVACPAAGAVECGPLGGNAGRKSPVEPRRRDCAWHELWRE